MNFIKCYNCDVLHMYNIHTITCYDNLSDFPNIYMFEDNILSTDANKSFDKKKLWNNQIVSKQIKPISNIIDLVISLNNKKIPPTKFRIFIIFAICYLISKYLPKDNHFVIKQIKDLFLLNSNFYNYINFYSFFDLTGFIFMLKHSNMVLMKSLDPKDYPIEINFIINLLYESDSIINSHIGNEEYFHYNYNDIIFSLNSSSIFDNNNIYNIIDNISSLYDINDRFFVCLDIYYLFQDNHMFDFIKSCAKCNSEFKQSIIEITNDYKLSDKHIIDIPSNSPISSNKYSLFSVDNKIVPTKIEDKSSCIML